MGCTNETGTDIMNTVREVKGGKQHGIQNYRG